MSVGASTLTLTEYLEKQPGTSFRRLYQQPSTTLAIFRRMLPSLAKTIVRWNLYMEGPMPLETLDRMITLEARRAKDRALMILRSLHIIQISAASKDRPQEMMLTSSFKKSFRLALEGGGDHNSFGVPSEIDVPKEINIDFLDRYARKKWEDILHYVVSSVEMSSSGHDSSGPKSSVKELLVAGRLVERTGRGVTITQTGFTFLLQAANAQVWTLLLQWLEAVDHSGNANSDMDSVDMLSFLFMLSTLELGRAYDTTALTDQRRNMLPSLVDFGLVYIPPNERTTQYFPTRLATTLTSSAAALQSVSSGLSLNTTEAAANSGPPGAPHSGMEEGIILETNYRLYAYTHSRLQIAVLALFAKLSSRFPGMVKGKLTRDSIHRAISYGISSDQIITYLALNAHPQMRQYAANNNRPVLPPTVVDQIRLWQLENERMKSNKGFLFKEFESTKEYEALVQHAEDIGVLIWRHDRRQQFFVTKHEQLANFLKAKKKANQAV
jgi:transcription initiation factor TFIIH subunit 4